MMHYDSKDSKYGRDLRKGAPKDFEALTALEGSVFADDDEHALSKKTRELMAIAVATTTQCPHCVEIHSRAAAKAGATEAEVSEAVMVSAASAGRRGHNPRVDVHEVLPGGRLPGERRPGLTLTLSHQWVRGAVVAAQQIPTPAGPNTYADAAEVLAGIGLIQLDPLTRVSTAARLTSLTRLSRKHTAGDVDPALWPHGAPASFEAFTKVACLFPLSDWPLLRLRREAAQQRHGHKLDPTVTGRIRDLVAAHPGGVGTGVIEAEFGPERTAGWHWSQVKKATELMVRMGDLVVTARDGVVRLFDLPERALPEPDPPGRAAAGR